MKKAVKIDADLYERLSEVAKKRGVTISDVVNDAIAKYLGLISDTRSDKDIKDVKVVKNWKLQYEATCPICGKKMPPGTRVVREIIIYEDGSRENRFYHEECYNYSMHEKTLAKLDLEIWKRKKILKGYEEMLKDYREAISEAETRMKLLEVARSIEEATQSAEKELITVAGELRELLASFRSKDEFREAAEKLLKKLEEANDKFQDSVNTLKQKLEELALSIGKQRKPKRIKRREEEYEEW